MSLSSLQHTVRHLDNARYTGGKRDASAIDSIVMHCTGGDQAEPAIGWMNRALGKGEGKASYHYLIPKSAKEGIIRMCDPLIIAYHAGKSVEPGPDNWPRFGEKRWIMPGRSLNGRSLGISFANDNGSDRDPEDDQLTPWQRKAGLWLCVTMCRRFAIKPWRIFGHWEVAPGRKTDPLPKIVDMWTWRGMIRDYLAIAAAPLIENPHL